MLKKGDMYKHFKGTSIDDKNIYEILEIGVKYSGDNSDKPIENLVVYRNVFQDKIFARELEDLIAELSPQKQKEYGQKHRIEKLNDEEIRYVREKIKRSK